MSLSATIKATINATQTSASDNSTASAAIALSKSITLSDGIAADQADLIWQDTRTLAASATEDLDLAGALVNSFGAAVVFAKIKAIMITAAAGNTNNVNVTRPASNGLVLFLAASDGIALTPGSVFLFADGTTGKAVTASTGDLLTMTNSGGTTGVTYSIVIIGTSA